MQFLAVRSGLFSLDACLCYGDEATCMANDVNQAPGPLGCFPEEWAAAISFPGVRFLPLLCRPAAPYSDPSLRTGERTSFPLLELTVSWQIFLLFLSLTKPASQFSSYLPFMFPHAPDDVGSTPPHNTLSPLLSFCWWLASHRMVSAAWQRGWWTRWTNSTFFCYR